MLVGERTADAKMKPSPTANAVPIATQLSIACICMRTEAGEVLTDSWKRPYSVSSRPKDESG